jgi:two-component sensor histidine kinase
MRMAIRETAVSPRGARRGQVPASSFSVSCASCEIVTEADHRIANHLAMLAGIVRLKSADLRRSTATLDRADVALILEGVTSQIASVGRLHRSLAHKADGSVDLGQHLHDVCAPLSEVCTGVDIVENFSAGCMVQPDQVLPVTQIVSEVLTNAVKYGRPVEGRAVVLMRCFQDEARRVQVEVSDNGPGLPDGFDPLVDGGLGFRLLRGLRERLPARMEFKRGNTGLLFRLSLPSAAMAA